MDISQYVTINDYYPVNKGAFLGIITATLGGKVVVRMRVIRSKAGHIFANLPTDRIDVNGDSQYVPMIQFLNSQFERDLCDYVSEIAKGRVDEPKEQSKDNAPF